MGRLTNRGIHFWLLDAQPEVELTKYRSINGCFTSDSDVVTDGYRLVHRLGGSQTRLSAETAAKTAVLADAENSPQLVCQTLTILPNETVVSGECPRVVSWTVDCVSTTVNL